MLVWLLIAQGIVSLGSSALAWAYPWRVHRVGRGGARASAELGALPASERRPGAAALAGEGGWLGELVAAVDEAPAAADRIAAINEVLTTVSHLLELSRPWPRAGAWLAASGTLLVLVGGFVLGGRGELGWVALLGVVALSGCLWAGSVGRRQAERARQQVDALVQLLAGDLDDRDVPMRGRRRRRRC